MNIEIERKFLIDRDESWEKLEGKRIVQGYLVSDDRSTVRIRKKGRKGFITIKGKTEGTSRKEFEYEIPSSDAEKLFELCNKPLINKIRRKLPKENIVWEIDEFFNENEGLLLAEVELENEEQEIQLPGWIKKEVTGDPRYYNSQLAKNPYKNWKE